MDDENFYDNDLSYNTETNSEGDTLGGSSDSFSVDE